MPTVRYTVIDGELIAEKRNGVRRLYVPDPLGSTVTLLDNTQTITDRFSYWPYGEEASRTGTTPTPFRFVGTRGYHRDKYNSIYIRRRHYRPDVGRWLTGDPIGFAGGSRNLHDYVGGRATTALDASGLRMCPKWPRSACFQCYFMFFYHTGSTALDACKAASRMCLFIPGGPGGSCGEWTAPFPDPGAAPVQPPPGGLVPCGIFQPAPGWRPGLPPGMPNADPATGLPLGPVEPPAYGPKPGVPTGPYIGLIGPSACFAACTRVQGFPADVCSQICAKVQQVTCDQFDRICLNMPPDSSRKAQCWMVFYHFCEMLALE